MFIRLFLELLSEFYFLSKFYINEKVFVSNYTVSLQIFYTFCQQCSLTLVNLVALHNNISYHTGSFDIGVKVRRPD